MGSADLTLGDSSSPRQPTSVTNVPAEYTQGVCPGDTDLSLGASAQHRLALAVAQPPRKDALVRHVGLLLATAGVFVVVTAGCSRDEDAHETCGNGTKCAPMSIVNSKRLGFMCMSVAPKASTVGEVVDRSAVIDFNGHQTATVARAALIDGSVVEGFYVLSPSQPTCSEPMPNTPASAIAFDPASYSTGTLEQLLNG